VVITPAFPTMGNFPPRAAELLPRSRMYGGVRIRRRMWPFVLLTSYCLLVMASSLLGGVLPTLLRITHTRMQLTMSFVGGLMLGVAVVHLLPHSILMMRDGNAFRLDSSMFWMLVG